jgi:alpha-beta hydrolase superfamily lysophospholipase
MYDSGSGLMSKYDAWQLPARGMFVLVALYLLSACASPYDRPAGAVQETPYLGVDFAIMDDGFRLPVTHWEPATQCRATILALHGLNDYRNAFQSTGEYLSAHGIRVLAYDQRGFGETSGFGEWHGSERLIKDLDLMITLVQKRFPDCPLYLLGESMGGAVVLAGAGELRERVAGLILVAPAVWSRDSMPLYQRALLWLAAHSFPDRRLTGKGLDLHPSDNIEMLRALGRDPRVIKETRVDVLYGVTNLMDQAVYAGHEQQLASTLFLYGERDDIIPKAPTCRLLQQLPVETDRRLQVALYENGYHMLTRDLQAERVLEDIVAWVTEVPDGNRLTRNNVEQFCSGSS